MEITITSRHAEVPERFRRHLEDKLTKVEQVAPHVSTADVVITKEANPRQSKASTRVEVTCRGKSAVVRAEAAAEEEYAALDLTIARLLEQIRRMQDRRRVRHGRRAPESVGKATARLAPTGSEWDSAGPDGAGPSAAQTGDGVEAIQAEGDSPIEVREKVHTATPMSLEQALYEMELVGHDFYLYQEAGTGRPSVVYRRRGWSYGVIRLQHDEHDDRGEPAAGQDRPAVATGG